jgi:hypothetical protein
MTPEEMLAVRIRMQVAARGARDVARMLREAGLQGYVL